MICLYTYERELSVNVDELGNEALEYSKKLNLNEVTALQ